MFEHILRLFTAEKARAKDFVQRCILVVDDNETDRMLVRRTVEKMGHRVLVAEDGNVGFEMAKTKKPDLILSDCRMPQKDGITMCRQLKGDPQTKNIPLVFLTGVDSPATVVECFDMGVENYMCKPINPKILVSQIETILKECLTL
jgi:CheY-like chemotaxis protein